MKKRKLSGRKFPIHLYNNLKLQKNDNDNLNPNLNPNLNDSRDSRYSRNRSYRGYNIYCGYSGYIGYNLQPKTTNPLPHFPAFQSW